MNKNRLSKTLAAALNVQITKKAQASQIYLSYASWAENLGFERIANFLFMHAEGERNQMIKILEYILIRGAEVHITAIPAPHENPVSINSCFEKVFEYEVENSKAVYKLVKLSFDEEDWATWNFMQLFLNEKIEEDTLTINLLDKMKIADRENACSEALYSFDRDPGNTPGRTILA